MDSEKAQNLYLAESFRLLLNCSASHVKSYARWWPTIFHGCVFLDCDSFNLVLKQLWIKFLFIWSIKPNLNKFIVWWSRGFALTSSKANGRKVQNKTLTVKLYNFMELYVYFYFIVYNFTCSVTKVSKKSTALTCSQSVPFCVVFNVLKGSGFA